MNVHLAPFHAIADDPIGAIRHLAARGKRPLGYFSANFPVEIAMAFGFTPVRLTGFKKKNNKQIIKLPMDCCSIGHTTLEVALSGKLECLEGVVFPQSCETLEQLVLSWRENKLHSFTPTLQFPIDMYDEDAYPAFKKELQILIGLFADRSGKTFDPEELRETIRITNEQSELFERLISLRRRGIITMSDTLGVARAATLSDRAEFVDLLEGALCFMEDAPEQIHDGPRLLIWGGIFDNRPLADLIEALGGRIVGDSLTTLTDDFVGLIDEDGDPLEKLIDFYFNRMQKVSVISNVESRTRRLEEMVEELSVDAVVFTHVKSCFPHAIDYPLMKLVLDGISVPNFLVEYDLWGNGVDRLSDGLADFIRQMKVEKSARYSDHSIEKST